MSSSNKPDDVRLGDRARIERRQADLTRPVISVYRLHILHVPVSVPVPDRHDLRQNTAGPRRLPEPWPYWMHNGCVLLLTYCILTSSNDCGQSPHRGFTGLHLMALCIHTPSLSVRHILLFLAAVTFLLFTPFRIQVCVFYLLMHFH